MDLREEISLAVEAAGLEGKGFLAAVSGGVDSVTLVRLLSQAGIRVEIAHVDHGLRVDSSNDAEFCRALAAELDVPFHLLTLTREDFPKGVNTQAEARNRRRGFLEDTLQNRGLGAIALAHHAGDQAETVLFRMLRGSGPRGVCGMSRWEPPYLRPLLFVRRADIERCAAENNFAFREDPTNSTPRYSRNRIRRELLPLARAICPGADEAIVRYSELARRDEEYLTFLALQEFEKLAKREPEGISFPVQALEALPLSIRSRIFLAAFRSLGEDTGVLSSAHLAEIEALLAEGKPYRRSPTPGSLGFARSYDRLWVVAKTVLRPAPAETEKGGFGEGVHEKKAIPENSLSAELPKGRPDGEVKFRLWRPGDRLSGRKAKDILMDARVERWRRGFAVVAEDREGILALFAPGVPERVFCLSENESGSSGIFVSVGAGWWKAPLTRKN